MSTPVRLLLASSILAALAGAGCRSPDIRELRLPANPIVRTGGRNLIPTSATRVAEDEASFFRMRDEAERGDGASPERLLEIADLADEIGTRRIHKEPAAAIPWFRDAAAFATFSLTVAGPPDPASPIQALAIARHNHAVEELIRCAGTGPNNTNLAWREQLAADGVELAPTQADRVSLPLDELWIASDFRLRGLREIRRDGFGVPLVALSLFPNREALPDHFYPPRMRLPATASIQPTGGLRDGVWRSQPVRLELHDPVREATVKLGTPAGDVPLAADISTPFAHQMIKSPLRQLSWGGFFRPEEYASALGIFMEAPYQPGKIPVIFIHGLWSSPDIWATMANNLHVDPAIRDRYQFWFAYYPTGAPVMVSATGLRKSLRALRETVDPQKSDAAFDQMVVVGHSLGGILSRQLIQSSQGSLERVLFTRPLSEIEMSPESRTILSEALTFEPVPEIRRAIFIAAPHHGSNTANQFIGRLGSTLIRRPGKLQQVYDEVISMNGPEVIQPFYRRRPPSSIDNLTWDSPILRTLSALPSAAGVPYHSIIANLCPDAPPKFWSDGLVSYESAHLEGADSEVMIKHNHFANDTPEAIAEAHRILRLHIGLGPMAEGE